MFRPLQLPANSGDELPFFRVDGRLSDAELRKYLTDFNKYGLKFLKKR